MDSASRTRGTLRVTTRGWIYLALSVSVGFAAAAKGNNLLFAVFSLLTALFLICGFLTFIVAQRITAARVLPPAVCAGEMFLVGVRFRNAKRLWPAFCLKFQDRLTQEGPAAPAPPPVPVWLPFAAPGERIGTAYSLTVPYRGHAKLGPFALTSEFTPGFFVYRATLPGEDALLVFPRPAWLNRRVLNAYLSRSPLADTLLSSSLGGEEVFAGLREYRPGDNLRRIHWKMSARMPGRLMVREFEDPRVRRTRLMLETDIPHPKDTRRRARMERAITFSIALVDALLAAGHSVTFQAFAPELLTVSLEPRPGATAELQYALALLSPPKDKTLGDLLAQREETEEELVIVARIGDDPFSRSALPRRSVVVSPVEIRALTTIPS